MSDFLHERSAGVTPFEIILRYTATKCNQMYLEENKLTREEASNTAINSATK